VLLLMANAGVVAATGAEAPEAWRRVVAYMIQAFAARGAGPIPEAPSPRQMFRAMVRINRPES